MGLKLVKMMNTIVADSKTANFASLLRFYQRLPLQVISVLALFEINLEQCSRSLNTLKESIVLQHFFGLPGRHKEHV